MKKLIAVGLFVGAVACNQSEGYTKAEDAQDAGRQFIQASLDGNYKKATFYLLKDSVNLLLIEKLKSEYDRMSTEQKRQHKDAAIRPVEIKPVNDSVTTYNYYQTANPSDTTALRVVHHNGEWLVDLKSVIKM